MFRDAQRILVDDVGGVFIAHRWQGDLFKPVCKGTVFVNQIPTVYMDAIGVMTGFGAMFISVTLNNSGPEFLPPFRRDAEIHFWQDHLINDDPAGRFSYCFYSYAFGTRRPF